MNLLLINFETNPEHSALGWQAEVLEGLAARCQKVLLITDKVENIELPENVHVVLISELVSKVPKLGKWLTNLPIAKLCLQHQIDTAFIHMAKDWAYLLAPALKLLRIPVLMWYAHDAVTPKLKWAAYSVDRIVTSVEGACNVALEKVYCIGQGINTDTFQIPKSRKPLDLLVVGRISQLKKTEEMIEVAHALNQKSPDCFRYIRFIGPVMHQNDIDYDQRVRRKVWALGIENKVRFEGYVPRQFLPKYYEETALNLNLCHKQCIDKTALEALACGTPILASSAGFTKWLGDYPEFEIKDESPSAVAEQAYKIITDWNNYDPEKLRSVITQHHSIEHYVDEVMLQLEDLKGAQS